MAATLIMSETVAFMGTIWTGFSRPIRTGPITVPPPSCCRSLAEMWAVCRAGMISTLAGPLSRQNG